MKSGATYRSEGVVRRQAERTPLPRERRPHAISSRRAYDVAMREIEELTMRGTSRSSAETEYYRVICALAAGYVVLRNPRGIRATSG